MNDTLLVVLCLGIAYLLGSIPFGYLLVRTFRGEDVRATGSGNIGATNVARSGAKGLGIATLLLDALKGWIAVYIAHHLVLQFGTLPRGYDVMALAGLFAVLGHLFPVWLRFRGGKGVATAAGVFLFLAPLATGLALLIFTAVFALTRFVSLASIVGATVLAALAILFDGHHRLIVYIVYVALAVAVLWKHSANIARLRAGTEPKFGSGSGEKPPEARA